MDYIRTNPNGSLVARAHDIRMLAIRAVLASTEGAHKLVLPECEGHVTRVVVDGYGIELQLSTDDTTPVDPRRVRDLLRYFHMDKEVLITRRG